MTVLGHGIGGRTDLPLPLWLFAYGAGAAVVISFVALGASWRSSRFEGRAARPLGEGTRPMGRALEAVGRVVGVALFGGVLGAGWVGDTDPLDNFAPVAVYVAFWVGMQIVSAVVGDVWRVLSPFETLALGVAWIRRRAGAARPGPDGDGRRWGHWPAAAVLLGFVWLELVHPDRTSPRLLAGALTAYTVFMLAGAARYGRLWLRDTEGFAVWFGLLARIAPFTADERGRVSVRPPLSGLAGLDVRPGTVAVVLVALGSTSFDGLTRTQFWTDLIGSRTGWGQVPLATAGLVWTIGVFALAYFTAMRLAARGVGRDPAELVPGFVHSLVPIALAYAVAHYFSLLVFEGQRFVRLASDPLARGWDLFGTAHNVIDYTAVSVTAIAWVQAAAIVARHVAGVVVAHDRAVAWFPADQANRSQYPLVAVMVLYTVGGLAILLEG